MSLEKLPVPTEAQITLLASDFGSVFQARMNAVTVALRNAIIAFNAQIDAAQTASQQVEPAPLDVALAGVNNTYKMTALRVWQQVQHRMVGSVSYADGLANGAFFQRAYNPNGVVFFVADGSMKCFMQKTVSVIANEQIDILFDFPGNFINVPYIAPLVNGHTSTLTYTMSQPLVANYTTQSSTRIFGVFSESQQITIQVLAEGFWYQ